MWVRGLDWAQLGDTPVFSIPVTVPVSSCRSRGQLAGPSAAGHPHWPHSRVSQLARCWLRHLGCFPRGVSSCQWLARAGRERRQSTCAQRLQGFLRLRLKQTQIISTPSKSRVQLGAKEWRKTLHLFIEGSSLSHCDDTDTERDKIRGHFYNLPWHHIAGLTLRSSSRT